MKCQPAVLSADTGRTPQLGNSDSGRKRSCYGLHTHFSSPFYYPYGLYPFDGFYRTWLWDPYWANPLAYRGGEKKIWLAPLDRRTPPRVIALAGDQVSFGADGDLVFRSLEGKTNWLVRIKKDGSGKERITTAPVLEEFGVSPDGKWAIVFSPGAGENAAPAVLAVPVYGGAPRKLCFPDCWASWSSDGTFFYVESLANASTNYQGNSRAEGQILA